MAHPHTHEGHAHGGIGHTHAPKNFGFAFAVGVGLNLAYVVFEAAYGFVGGSLALVADAGHNLSDVFGLLLAWGAATLARKAPSERRTYGMRRSSILAAMFNAMLLLVAIGAIAWEAIGRFAHPEPVAGGTVAMVAGIGIVVNAATAMLFAKGRENDINIQGAFLHMAADALVSLAVVIAGLVIRSTGLLWVDPVISLVVVVVIAWSTWDLLRQSFNLALDAVPEGIDIAQVRSFLEGIDGVSSVHDLHIWGMSTTEAALTAHLVVPKGLTDTQIRHVGEDLHNRFGIEHPTLQIERGTEGSCPLEPDSVV